MPFLPDRISVLAFPARLFGCLLLTYGDLLEGVVVHRRYFVPLQCTPFFLLLLPLLYDLGALGKNQLVFSPRLEVGGLLSPLSDVVVENPYLSQKGDTFGHHHGI